MLRGGAVTVSKHDRPFGIATFGNSRIDTFVGQAANKEGRSPDPNTQARATLTTPRAVGGDVLATSSAPLAAQTLLVSEREHACEDKFWTITFCEALHTISVEVCWIELNRTGERPDSCAFSACAT